MTHQKDFKEILHYQEILKKNENDIKALFQLGTLYLNHEMWEHALPYFLKIESIKPNPEILQNIGVIFYKKKEYSKALEYYEKSEKAGRNAYELNLNRGICYEKMRNPEKAVYYLKKAYEESPKIEICFKLAPLCLEAKHFNDAVYYYKLLIEHEENPFHYAELGLAYSQINEFELAKQCYQKAKSLARLSDKYPKIEQMTFNDFEMKYPDLPKQLADKKKKIENNQADYLDHVDVGNMLFIQEDYDSALHSYQKARDEFLYQLIFKL